MSPTEDRNNPPANDHDLLIRIDQRVLHLDTALVKHLNHHWAVTLLSLSALLAALGAIAVGIARAAAP